MAFNVSEFKANGLRFGGARPNQFSVDIFPPFATPNANRIRLLCKAASIPPAILGEIRVSYFGRAIKVPGDREFPGWSVTIYNDDDMSMRVMMERWSNEMNSLISNRMSEAVYPQGYKQSAIVTQYTKIGAIARQWELRGLWPSDVAAMPLDWDATNQIQQFDVNFAYDEWAPYANESVAIPEDFNPIIEDVDGIG
jgi:hypothetical protein